MKKLALLGIYLLFLFLLLSPLAQVLNAQDTTEAALRRKFNQLNKKDIDFPRFLQTEAEETNRGNELKRNPKLAFRTGTARVNSACGNGDFENNLDNAEWSGAYGSVSNGLNFSTLTSGIQGGAIGLGTSRQTIVAAGTDPNVGISTVPPGGSTKSLRIGNSLNGYGIELVQKRITVSSATPIIRFWYAVVLEDPSHPAADQPYFWVRVVDNSSNTEINNVSNIGVNGKVVSNRANPFFQQRNGGALLFKDWSCAQVDLSQHIGKDVTIQFITQDCAQGGHYGYAYIDNICVSCIGSNEGDIQFSAKNSDCGVGKICLDYSLQKIGSVTGTLSIDLKILQNGVVVATLNSGPISGAQNGQYCFNINPSSISGLNNSLAGFDYQATGRFTINSFTDIKAAGSPLEGVKAGQNNDYKISCSPPSSGCCPGTNLVKNGDFETAQPLSFSSGYQQQTTIRPNLVLPGQFAIANVNNVNTICQYWMLPGRTAACNTFGGNFLVVNGRNNLPVGTQSVIWHQNVTLPQNGSYRLCLNTLPFMACCFNVVPKITVLVTDAAGNTIAVNSMNATQSPCGNLLSYYFTTGAGNVTIKIMLAEDGTGDGNDLALDNIFLVNLQPLPATLTDFGENISPIDGNGKYTITATSATLPAGAGFYWEIQDITDPANPQILSNPSPWWANPLSTNFNGYDNGVIANTTIPGIFLANRTYRIVRGTWGDCNSWSSVSHIYKKEISANRIVAQKDNKYISPAPKLQKNTQ